MRPCKGQFQPIPHCSLSFQLELYYQNLQNVVQWILWNCVVIFFNLRGPLETPGLVQTQMFEKSRKPGVNACT